MLFRHRKREVFLPIKLYFILYKWVMIQFWCSCFRLFTQPQPLLPIFKVPFNISYTKELPYFCFVACVSKTLSFPSSCQMGRMHSKGKGISKSARPYKRTPASWVKTSAVEVMDQICKLAKKGLRPSQIGVMLRDAHGIAQSSTVTGKKVLRVLKAKGLAPEIPEDLYMLIKKAVAIRKHLERNRKVSYVYTTLV